MIVQRIIDRLKRLFAKPAVFYIGGSEILPPPLSAEEETAAVAACQAGDRKARDTLIEHNLRLVVFLARKFESSGVGTEDLISIGTIGLIKAVDTYNPARRVRFASYASQCIENEIRMHLRRIRREGTTTSLQEPIEAGDGGLTVADVLPDDFVMEEHCEQTDTARRLRALVAALPARDRELLALRYGLDGRAPMTQRQVAARFGISRSYISRLEKRALASLADSLRQG